MGDPAEVAFDAYHRWLGIPPEEQPPNLYRLLGIALFEPSTDVIEAAADRQMGHLRTYQTGPHSALSQQLLNEVAAARQCLLDPRRKAAYDAELKAKLGPRSRPLPPPLPRPAAVSDRGSGPLPPPLWRLVPRAEPGPDAALRMPPTEPTIQGQSATARYRRRSMGTDVIAAACVTAVLLGGMVLFLTWTDRDRQVSLVGNGGAQDKAGWRQEDRDVHLPTGDGQEGHEFESGPTTVQQRTTKAPTPRTPIRPAAKAGEVPQPVTPAVKGGGVSQPQAASPPMPTAGTRPASGQVNLAEPKAAEPQAEEPEAEDLFARPLLPTKPDSAESARSVPRPMGFHIVLPDGSAFSDAEMCMTADALDTLFPKTATVCVFCFPKGQLKAVFTHQYGKLNGPAASLYESGALCSVAFFKDGLRNGPLRLWEDGRRRLLYAEYRLGQEHGTRCLFKDDRPWYMERWTRGVLTRGYLVRFLDGKWIAVPAETLTDEPTAQEVAKATAKLQQLRDFVRAGELDAKQSVDAWYDQVRREAATAHSLQARQAIINRMQARQAEENAQMQQMWRTALRLGGL